MTYNSREKIQENCLQEDMYNMKLQITLPISQPTIFKKK
jgi:hypothetical protein